MSALKYLVVIGIILTACGFTSDILGEYIGPIEFQGYLGFGYSEGVNPVNNIVFTVDPTIADNLIILNVPSMWSHSYNSGVLTLSGGSLNPGESVLVTVSLNKYFEEGEYAVNSIGTTTGGEQSQASGPLLVGELYLLNLLALTSDYRNPLAAVVGALLILEMILSQRRKRTVDDTADKGLSTDHEKREKLIRKLNIKVENDEGDSSDKDATDPDLVVNPKTGLLEPRVVWDLPDLSPI